MFRAHVLIVRRSKLYYTASGITTPIGGRPMHRLRGDWMECIPLWYNKIQYTAHSSIELYIVTDRNKNHQRGIFALPTSYPNYTKPATPTKISMLRFLQVYIAFSYFNLFYKHFNVNEISSF